MACTSALCLTGARAVGRVTQIVVILAFVVGCSDEHVTNQHSAVSTNSSPNQGTTDELQIAKEYVQQGKADRLHSKTPKAPDQDHWIRVDTNSTASKHQETYGEQQLLEILKDRPSMKGIVHRHEFIYRWAVMQFDASKSHDQIRWESLEPQSGRPAEHNSTYQDSPAYVRITAADSISGRD